MSLVSMLVQCARTVRCSTSVNPIVARLSPSPWQLGRLHARGLFVQTQTTPNPNSLMFEPGVPVLAEGTADFPNIGSARRSPLARNLFRVPGVTRVFMGTTFVTITKEEDIEWQVLKPDVYAQMMDFFASNQPVVIAEEKEHENSEPAPEKELTLEDEIVVAIKEVLDEGIRPYVQEDGGDIEFVSFDDGIVRLKLQGACASCPSSSFTLKMRVETMLQTYIHQVKAVEQVHDEDEDQPLKLSHNPYKHIEDQIKPKPRS